MRIKKDRVLKSPQYCCRDDGSLSDALGYFSSGSLYVFMFFLGLLERLAAPNLLIVV